MTQNKRQRSKWEMLFYLIARITSWLCFVVVIYCYAIDDTHSMIYFAFLTLWLGQK